MPAAPSDQYRQFNVTAVTAPTYNSVGLESGRNILIGCPNKMIDLSLARTIRLGGSRQLQFRIDAFNAFNTVIYTGRNSTINWTTPTNLTVRNSQTLPDGSIDPTRVLPRNAGFGAANGAADDAQLPGDDSLPVLARIRHTPADHVSPRRGSRGWTEGGWGQKPHPPFALYEPSLAQLPGGDYLVSGSRLKAQGSSKIFE